MTKSLEQLIEKIINRGFKELRDTTLEMWIDDIKKINYYDFFNNEVNLLLKEKDKNKIVISENSVKNCKEIVDKFTNQNVDVNKYEIEEFRKKYEQYIKQITSDNYYISDELIINILKEIKTEIRTNNNNDILKEIYDSEAVTTVINDNKDIILCIADDYVCNLFVKTFRKIYNDQFGEDKEMDFSQKPFGNSIIKGNSIKTNIIDISYMKQCQFILGIQDEELFERIDDQVLEKIDRMVAANILVSKICEDDFLYSINYFDYLNPNINNISEEKIISNQLFFELSNEYEKKFNKRIGIPEPSSNYTQDELLKIIIKCLETGRDDYEEIVYPHVYDNNIIY